MPIANHAFDDIEGLDVYTSDEEQIGTVTQVLKDPDDPTQHFVVIQADELAGMLGTSQIYVPDSDILQIEEDRLVLDVTSDALNRPDWTTPPQQINPSA